VKSLPVESLDIVELHYAVIILSPPSLSLPFVKHLSASNSKAISSVCHRERIKFQKQDFKTLAEI
jgi:hypothetical protein